MVFGNLHQQITHFFSDFNMNRHHDLLIFFGFSDHLQSSHVINSYDKNDECTKTEAIRYLSSLV